MNFPELKNKVREKGIRFCESLADYTFTFLLMVAKECEVVVPAKMDDEDIGLVIGFTKGGFYYRTNRRYKRPFSYFMN